MVTRSEPRIREIVHADDPALSKAHGLLRRTFHKAELVGLADWRHSLREGEAGLWSDLRWHLVVAELAGSVLGVAAGTYLGNINTGVIGYLAVRASARGAGVGPKLRDKLRTLFKQDARQVLKRPLDAIIGEVRRDNPWLRWLIRHDRIIALDFEYLQPGLRRGARPVPLVLYYESLGRVRKSLPTSLIRRILYTTWRRTYRIARPMSNTAFRRMLGSLAGKQSIGEIKLSALRPPSRSSALVPTAGGNHA